MPQKQFAPDGAVIGPAGWFENHRADYARVQERLRGVRAVTLHGREREAAENLRRAYLFAVLSIQTERDRHERAFTRLCAGDADVREACLETVYGGQKADWIARTESDVDWAELVRDVREHVRAGEREALLAMCTRLTGVAYRKWAFTLAMAGVWEVCCIDSNVARELGISARAAESPEKASAREYERLVERVREAVGADVPPFVAQWAVYDFARGEHARHLAFFREVHGFEPK